MRKVAVLLGIFLPASLTAHHSFVDYDTDDVVELEGELIEVRWRNPHPSFSVAVQGETWTLDAGGKYALERSGINADSFTIGDQVRVAGWRSRSRPNSVMFVTNMLLSDQSELVMLPTGGITNRWSNEFTGGVWLGDVGSEDRRGIFRTWSAESLDIFVQASLGIEVQLTDEAQSKMAEAEEFDPCELPGMPGVMVAPIPIQFVDRGNHIDLQLALEGILRTIEMTAGTDPASVPVSKQGYSVGRWVEEGNTLEVRTTRISWPWFDDAGRPQTEDVEIVERFTLAGNGDRLEYAQTVSDPASFVEPVTLNWYWVDIGEQMFIQQNCAPQQDP